LERKNSAVSSTTSEDSPIKPPKKIPKMNEPKLVLYDDFLVRRYTTFYRYGRTPSQPFEANFEQYQRWRDRKFMFCTAEDRKLPEYNQEYYEVYE
jgi:hypothetical protein